MGRLLDQHLAEQDWIEHSLSSESYTSAVRLRQVVFMSQNAGSVRVKSGLFYWPEMCRKYLDVCCLMCFVAAKYKEVLSERERAYPLNSTRCVIWWAGIRAPIVQSDVVMQVKPQCLHNREPTVVKMQHSGKNHFLSYMSSDGEKWCRFLFLPM